MFSNGASNVPVRERMQEDVCEAEMDRVRGANYVPRDVFETERGRVRGANYVPHDVFEVERGRVRGANYVPHDACEVRDRRYGTSSEPRAPVWFEPEGYSLENPCISTRNAQVKREQRVLLPEKDRSRSVGLPQVRKPILRPQNYSGVSSWHDYRQHFENCAAINGWNDMEKLLFLSAALTETATSVLVGVKYDSYSELCAALERRFGPAQAALCKSELRARRQKKGESYQSLAEDIRRLTMLAYPELPEDAWQSMACEAFIDSISSDEARRFVLQAMPSDLLSAVTAARQFEAIKSRERDRKLEVPVQVRAVDQVDEVYIKESIDDLARQVKSLAVSQKSLFEQVNTLQLNEPNQRFSTQQNTYAYPVPYGYQNGFNQPIPGLFRGPQAWYYSNQRYQRPPQPRHNRCFRCNQEGHFKRECPLNTMWRGGLTNPLERQ